MEEKKELTNADRQPCEIYTRVMGYMRNVNNFNVWKKAEFYWRVYFDQNKSANSKFIEDFTPNPKLEEIEKKETEKVFCSVCKKELGERNTVMMFDDDGNVTYYCSPCRNAL